MLYTTVARIQDEDVPRLRAWLAELASRRGELEESYRQQGTRQEQFFLIQSRRMPLLVIVSEVEDAEHASRSFLHSKLPIDIEFKSLFQEVSQEESGIELLYDSARLLGIAAA